MKKKSFNKKLFLQKKTIVPLTDNGNHIKGGFRYQTEGRECVSVVIPEPQSRWITCYSCDLNNRICELGSAHCQ